MCDLKSALKGGYYAYLEEYDEYWMPAEEAFRIIEEEAGSHFDPKQVKVFLKHKDEFKNVDVE